MENKRICLWDNLKFILITFVIMGHFIQQSSLEVFKSLLAFIVAFHMPLFLFISGLFHRNKNIKQKVITFIAFGYIYKFSIYILCQILGQEPKLSIFNTSAAPWYMFMMAAAVSITYFCRNTNPWLVFFTTVLLSCFSGYDTGIRSYLVLSRIFVYYPFYALGVAIDHKKIAQVTQKTHVRIIGLIIIGIWAYFCFGQLKLIYPLINLFTGRHPFEESYYIYGGLLRLLCVAITILVGFSFISIAPRKEIPFITRNGKRTLQVYFWHRLVLYVLVDVGYVTTLCSTSVGALLYVLSSIAWSFILCVKPLGFPTNQIFNMFKPTTDINDSKMKAGVCDGK